MAERKAKESQSSGTEATSPQMPPNADPMRDILRKMGPIPKKSHTVTVQQPSVVEQHRQPGIGQRQAPDVGQLPQQPCADQPQQEGELIAVQLQPGAVQPLALLKMARIASVAALKNLTTAVDDALQLFIQQQNEVLCLLETPTTDDRERATTREERRRTDRSPSRRRSLGPFAQRPPHWARSPSSASRVQHRRDRSRARYRISPFRGGRDPCCSNRNH